MLEGGAAADAEQLVRFLRGEANFFSLRAAGHPARRHRVKYCHDQI